MSVTIYEEDIREQKKKVDWKNLVTEAEYKRGLYYYNQFNQRFQEISDLKEEWDTLQELAACHRNADPDDPDYPNNFFPIITPMIEGQTAAMIEGNIDFTHMTDMPSQQIQMARYNAISDYIRRANLFLQHFKDFTRKYLLLGNSWVTLLWEDSINRSVTSPEGFPRIMTPSLFSVLVDGRIKDYKDLQYADYIIHVIGFQSIGWARKQYGPEKAEALTLGYNNYEGNDPDQSVDDGYTFTLLHVWTRDNEQGNLQLVEMTSDGFILQESDPSKPYYKYVDNEYPFYMARMIPVEGQFYGKGDGMVLLPMQKTINNLVDELELAARFSAQSKVIVDKNAFMDVDSLNSNPAEFGICDSPRENILVIPGGGINPVVERFIHLIIVEAQRAIRFSDIMTGNQQGSSATATQITNQIRQGSVGINDKKTDISHAMEWVDRYAINMCLEKWTKPFWVAIDDNFSEFIDTQEMTHTAALAPISIDTIEKLMKRRGRNRNRSVPTFEEVRDEKNELVRVRVSFSTRVIMDTEIPTGKIDIYNILLGLSQMKTMDAQGRIVPIITANRLIELLEQTLGMKLKTEKERLAMEDQEAQMETTAQTNQNPIGQSGVVQQPQAQSLQPNLAGVVPQVPNQDNRGLVL